MNIFKNMTILVALAAFGLINARGKTETTPQQLRTEQRRYEESESKQKQSAPTFSSLADWIKTSPMIWDSNKNDFNTQALNSLFLQAQEANLNSNQFHILLELATVCHAQFPSENIDGFIEDISRRIGDADAAYYRKISNDDNL